MNIIEIQITSQSRSYVQHLEVKATRNMVSNRWVLRKLTEHMADRYNVATESEWIARIDVAAIASHLLP